MRDRKEELDPVVLESFFKESKYLKNKVLVKTFSDFIEDINSIQIKSHYEKSDINARSIKIALHNSKHVPLGDNEKEELLNLFILHTSLLKGESFGFSKFVVHAKNLVNKYLMPEFNNMYIFIEKAEAEKAEAEKAEAEKAEAEKAEAEKAEAEKAEAEKAEAEKAEAEKAEAEKAEAEKAEAEKAEAEKVSSEKISAEKAEAGKELEESTLNSEAAILVQEESESESYSDQEVDEAAAKLAFDTIVNVLPSDRNSFYRLTKGAKKGAFESLVNNLKCQQGHDTFEDLFKAFEGTFYERDMEAKMESYSAILPRFESIYGQVECPHDEI